jgi:hypothetical protein
MSLKSRAKVWFTDVRVWFNAYDPILWLIRMSLRGFLKVELTKAEQDFLEENIEKHRVVQWVNIAASIFVCLGLNSTEAKAITTVITSLLAPVMVLGTAWFAISFGGIPKKLLSEGMATTLWMFIAFVASLSAMFISVAFVTSIYLWPVLLLIYIGGLISCIKYDTADGLKAGLDEALLEHSRYAIDDYRLRKKRWQKRLNNTGPAISRSFRRRRSQRV